MNIFTQTLRVVCFATFAFMATIASAQTNGETTDEVVPDVAQPSEFETLRAQLNEQSLPILNLTVDIDKVTKPVYSNATLRVVDVQKRTFGVEDTTLFCKVKYRGSSAMGYDKKSFAVKLLNEKGKSLDAEMFGIRKDDAWILDAMAIDLVRMRNRLNFDIWNDMSTTPYATDYENRNGTKGLHVELFINGKYHGLYCFSDKVNRKLLGIKKSKVKDDETVTINGVMYKGEEWCDAIFLKGYNNNARTDTVKWNGWELDYPDEYSSEAAYAPLKAFIDFCAKTTDDEFVSALDDHVYMQNLIDYHVFILATGLLDNTMKNSFLSIVNINDEQRVMVTPWDLDRALSGSWNGTYYEHEATHLKLMQVKLFERLWNLNVNDYRNRVADRWRELCRENVLSAPGFNSRVDAFVQRITQAGAWKREHDRWNDSLGPRGPLHLNTNLEEEALDVKNWFSKNCQYLNDDLFATLGTPTIIKNVSVAAKDNPSSDLRYNLMGQKVDHTYKGIVVTKGGKRLQRAF